MDRAALLFELADAFGRADHVRQADAELLVNHDDFAVCDQSAVDEYVEGLAGRPIELDDRALIELQEIANRNARAPDLHRKCHWNVENDVHIHVAIDLRTSLGLEVFEFGGARLGCCSVHRYTFQAFFRILESVGCLGRRTRASTLTACWPRERPKEPRNIGTCSASTVTVPA